MLLRKGKRNQVCMLPTTEIEAQALVSLMKNYKKSHMVAFVPIGDNKIGVVTIMVAVSDEKLKEELLGEDIFKPAEMEKRVNES